MPDLCTLDQFKTQLRITHDLQDEDLEFKLAQAEALVLDYLKQHRTVEDPLWNDTVDGWDADTVPKQVQAAILTQGAELFRFRGDDEERVGGGVTSLPGDNFLSPRVRRLLDRLRDPALA